MSLDVPALSSEVAKPFLLSLADDELVMGHRLSFWVARGPTIEVDNEVAAIVQDELGHARLWYDVVAEAGETIEDLAFGRPAGQRRNTVLVEAPMADFGETIVRQFLYDRAEELFLSAIRDGDDAELSARAEVALREEAFHREHADVWLDHLSETEESRAHLEAGFEACLPRSRDLFAFPEGTSQELVEAGVLDRAIPTLHTEWIEEVVSTLSDLPLDVPLRTSPIENDAADIPDALEGEPATNGRLGEHTDELVELAENGFTEF